MITKSLLVASLFVSVAVPAFTIKGSVIKNEKRLPAADSSVMIVRKWELPPVLKEVSGIDWIGNNRFACVQDEAGSIYIYNTADNKVEKEIVVTSPGDFEGIAIVQSTAWLLRSDGTLFEAQQYNGSKPVIKEYHGFFTRKQNMEGLCYDAKNQRLLLAVKNTDPSGDAFKGVYAFNLSSKEYSRDPVYRLMLNDPLLGQGSGKKKIRPSDLAIHPVSGDVYVIDGEIPKLMILGSNGQTKALYPLPQKSFALPEGITFNNARRLYICNEGKMDAPNILEIKLGNGDY